MVQWVRLCTPNAGARVQSLVRELDPTHMAQLRVRMLQLRVHMLQLRSLHAVLKIPHTGASLVAQWLRICLPMQGTRVRVLVWEDPTCRGATGPVSHNY